MTTNISCIMKCISHYTRRCIMTINIFIIQDDVQLKYLFVLYKKTYNKIFVCLCYTRRCIIKYLFVLYKTMYNGNIYCHYTRRCIIKIFVCVIQDDV